LVTDVSGQIIGPIFKGKALACLTLEDGINGFSETFVTNYQSMQRKIREERRPQLYRGGSLKSRM
jgi:hypothetical protein